MRGLAPRAATAMMATLLVGTVALIGVAPAGAHPLARSATNSPKCTKFISVSRASAALGVAVKKPTVESTPDLINGKVESSRCLFAPVHPTNTYFAGEPVATVAIQADVSVGQFHKFVTQESTGAFYKGGTLSQPAGLGKDVDLDVLEQKEPDATSFKMFIAALRGHDMVVVYSEELTATPPLVALATAVYKKL